MVKNLPANAGVRDAGSIPGLDTMQGWDIVLEVRLPPQREVMRFVTWVFQRVSWDD